MIDLSHAPVVDGHCHPWRNEQLLDQDPAGFEDRITMMGMCLISSGLADDETNRFLGLLTETTPLALTMRRRLAEHLGCEPTREAVAAARRAALEPDPVAYNARLWESANVSGLVYDEGYPQPTIPRADFEEALGGVPVHRVGRIEPWIVDARETGNFEDTVAKFEEHVNAGGNDPRLVGYKTIIAYRTGLDISYPSPSEAAEAYDRWRADDWRETREHAKPVRDFLLERAFVLAKEHHRVFHVHVGGGDPDVNLAHASPKDVFKFFVDHQDIPILMIHSGYPWVA